MTTKVKSLNQLTAKLSSSLVSLAYLNCAIQMYSFSPFLVEFTEFVYMLSHYQGIQKWCKIMSITSASQISDSFNTDYICTLAHTEMYNRSFRVYVLRFLLLWWNIITKSHLERKGCLAYNSRLQSSPEGRQRRSSGRARADVEAMEDFCLAGVS